MEGMTTETLSRQVQQIWTMLDDMAENTPDAYRKFIDQQMKQAKQLMTPPEPHMCVHVTLLSKPIQPLFINFCSWSRVPEPKSSEDPVPVVGTKLNQEEDEIGTFWLISVSFNPKVLKEFGRSAKNPVDGDTLIQLALDYIEHEQKVKVSRTYTILPIDKPYKGDISKVQLSFSKMFKKEEKLQEHVSDLENTFGPLSSKEKGSLLSQLSRITGDSATSSQNPNLQEGELPEINLTRSFVSENKKGLIEVLSDNTVQKPEYSIENSESEIGKQLVLKVDLPGVISVAECQLDISEDDVILEVSGHYKLKVKLPNLIDDSQATARFNKKLSLLTVTLPVKT